MVIHYINSGNRRFLINPTTLHWPMSSKTYRPQATFGRRSHMCRVCRVQRITVMPQGRVIILLFPLSQGFPASPLNELANLVGSPPQPHPQLTSEAVELTDHLRTLLPFLNLVEPEFLVFFLLTRGCPWLIVKAKRSPANAIASIYHRRRII